jgi:hypothetical protein
MEAITVQRQKIESLATIPLGGFAFFFAYLSFEIGTYGFYAFLVGGIVLISKGIYPFLAPLATLENEKLFVYCNPFKKIEIDLKSVKSVHTSGPGIYPKNFHFELGSGKTSFNPNFSLIQNDGMVLKRFLEKNATAIVHKSVTNGKN